MHCKNLITPTEVANTIKLKKKTHQGMDSLQIEFYIFFWLDIKDLFMKMLFEVFKKGELSESQKLGVVSFLDKNDKYLLDIKAWRPLKCFMLITTFYQRYEL